MTTPWALRRPRLCEATHTQFWAHQRAWHLIRHGHKIHVCNRIRAFAHPHIGRHICECGVRWR